MSAPHAHIAGAARSIRGNCLLISRSALEQNLSTLRARAPGCEVLSVVKADGYGLGGELVASVFASAGVEKFGVATVEEGLTLRAGGIGGEILVLGGATWVSSPALLLDAGLTPVVSSVEEVERLGVEARRRGTRIAVHLAVDTGMSREGVYVGDDAAGPVAEVVRAAASHNVHIRGAMTHFANADLADSALTATQHARFAAALDVLIAAECGLEVAHIANSAATLADGGRPGPLADPRFSGLRWWVRPGIALYGATPFADHRFGDELVFAARWTAPVVVRKRVPAGTPVSYGSTYVTERETELAVLGIGYADGYHRSRSGRGAEVLIGGRRAPILGRVCMDLTVVDVTDVVSELGGEVAALGAEATVLGADGDECIGPWEAAEAAGTIAYEVITSVARRVPRIPVE